MASILRCRVGCLPFRYLGLFVGANMNLTRNWEPIVDTFRRRLSIWKANKVSFGGRITLIRSVLSSLPTYFFSLYKPPMATIRQLERLRRQFLWGSSLECAKSSWVAWNNVMGPKDLGGWASVRYMRRMWRCYLSGGGALKLSKMRIGGR
ncbi:hypothetical protein HanRHA438_Chr13g0602451 [Helianthus annuus]|nr:hypothetical protein HanRHA438_Chr13g0602451 [Helianthus annuus]